MGIGTEKLASLIRKELALIVNSLIKNDDIGFINITDVKITKDLSFGNVYYDILNNQKQLVSLAADILEKNKVILRMKLAKKIRNIRKIPNLIFHYDESLEKGNLISKILQDIKK